MKITESIAKGVTDVFFGENWTGVNVQQALSEVDFEMAQRKVPFTENTIAKILFHLKYSNEIVNQRAKGFPLEYNNETEGFAAPVFNSEDEWQNFIKETFDSAKILSETVQNFNEDNLHKPIVENFSSAYKNFQGIVEHAHYHLGQIVMIRKYLESTEIKSFAK